MAWTHDYWNTEPTGLFVGFGCGDWLSWLDQEKMAKQQFVRMMLCSFCSRGVLLFELRFRFGREAFRDLGLPAIRDVG